MLPVEPICPLSPPHIARTIVYVALGILGTLTSYAYHPIVNLMESEKSLWPSLYAILCLPSIILVPLALFLRHHRPGLVAAATSLFSLVLPIGNTVPLIAMSTLIGRRRGSGVTAIAALTLFTSSLIVVVDSIQQPRGNSVMKTFFSDVDPEEYVHLSPLLIVGVALGGWALSALLGWLIRRRRIAELALSQP